MGKSLVKCEITRPNMLILYFIGCKIPRWTKKQNECITDPNARSLDSFLF